MPVSYSVKEYKVFKFEEIVTSLSEEMHQKKLNLPLAIR